VQKSDSLIVCLLAGERLPEASASPQPVAAAVWRTRIEVAPPRRPSVCRRGVRLCAARQSSRTASCVSRTMRRLPPPDLLSLHLRFLSGLRNHFRSRLLDLKHASRQQAVCIVGSLSSCLRRLRPSAATLPHTHVTFQLPLPLHHSLISLFYFSVILHVLYCSLFFSSPRHPLPFPLLLSSPPLLLSSFSHAPVGEHNEMAMAGLVCVSVCVCVTPQQLYSRSLFFNPVLTDHSAILRFYIPFFKEASRGKASPCTVCVCWGGGGGGGSACLGFGPADNSYKPIGFMSELFLEKRACI